MLFLMAAMAYSLLTKGGRYLRCSPPQGIHEQFETLKRCCVIRTRTRFAGYCRYLAYISTLCRSMVIHAYHYILIWVFIVYCLTSTKWCIMRRTTKTEWAREQRKRRLQLDILSHVDFDERVGVGSAVRPLCFLGQGTAAAWSVQLNTLMLFYKRDGLTV